ncbi:DUF58 domain-containing protein [Vibrio sp. 10N.261.55.A7]|uniref:DUF58 domain-containing protein n=1 Tax=Vibrio sp. 10N.261.55.A7 TaxID=1880851 RepID=UPI000C861A55|nr:DUF58 domain-containing protein [Vibrio sp. 10N.261.55.A7]PMK03392.1 cytosolic protein [Vibrio sp. 10N.261.55.A7]
MAINKQPTLSPKANGVTLSLDELLYYKQQSIHWLPPAKNLWAQIAGQHQSRKLGRGMDFAEVRQYQVGDDIRSIDWRVTARTGKPHTKLFTEECEKPVVLYIDLSPSLFFGSTLQLKSVQVAHMASLLSWLCIANNDRIGAVIDTGHTLIDIKPTARDRGPLTLLQQVIKIHNEYLEGKHASSALNTTSMSEGLQALHRLCPKGSEIILLSDFVRLKDPSDPLIKRLRQHNILRMVHFSDPLEYGKTSFRGVERVANNDRSQWIDFSSKTNRRNIEKEYNQHFNGLKQSCQSLGISFTAISSHQPLLQQLSGQH